MKLLRTLILRPLRRDPLRTALTILSVALGVAVIVAIDLAGDAATGSFHSSMESLRRQDRFLQILANGGIDERYMAPLAALPFDVRILPRHRSAGDCCPASAPYRCTAWTSRAMPAPRPPKPSASASVNLATLPRQP